MKGGVVQPVRAAVLAVWVSRGPEPKAPAQTHGSEGEMSDQKLKLSCTHLLLAEELEFLSVSSNTLNSFLLSNEGTTTRSRWL